MTTPFRNKNILLGVTGSIAAYKAAELASRLAQAGAQVDVILTEAALQFITPLTFQSVTGRKAYTDADLWGGEGHVTHVALAHHADLFVIAPLTATTMARLAHGMADNLLSVAALAAKCPLLIAPAMDAGMFSHPATQSNLEILRQRGAVVVGPAAGHLASGLVGVGRMAEPAEILGCARQMLAAGGPLAGRKVVVTAGGTQEPVDPVRVLTNRSSGRQGYSLAQASLDAGAEVVLISGPVHIPPPVGARLIPIQTAEEMLAAVLAESASADALLMAAAVADFRPSAPAGQKIKKESGLEKLTLEPTPDILSVVAEQKEASSCPQVVVGFAAESQNLIENASTKLRLKKLDLIAANDITSPDAGFEVETNRVILLTRDGSVEKLPLMSKEEVAETIVQRVIAFLGLDQPAQPHAVSSPE